MRLLAIANPNPVPSQQRVIDSSTGKTAQKSGFDGGEKYQFRDRPHESSPAVPYFLILTQLVVREQNI
jgi:hypothetical protein